MTAERKRSLQVVDEWQYQLKADGKPWIILEPHQHWQLVERVTQAVTEAVAERDKEWEKKLKELAESLRQKGRIRSNIASAIRKVKP